MKLTNHDKILSVLSTRLYRTPEDICDSVLKVYGVKWKVSNVERRLRELAVKELVESKAYSNITHSGTHNRWRKVKGG